MVSRGDCVNCTDSFLIRSQGFFCLRASDVACRNPPAEGISSYSGIYVCFDVLFVLSYPRFSSAPTNWVLLVMALVVVRFD